MALLVGLMVIHNPKDPANHDIKKNQLRVEHFNLLLQP